MNDYAIERKAFGQSINRFGQVQQLIANSYASYMAGRTFLYNIASHLDIFKPGNRVDTDACKLFCGPMGKQVADNAIQVLGGLGYVGDGIVERLWREYAQKHYQIVADDFNDIVQECLYDDCMTAEDIPFFESLLKNMDTSNAQLYDALSQKLFDLQQSR